MTQKQIVQFAKTKGFDFTGVYLTQNGSSILPDDWFGMMWDESKGRKAISDWLRDQQDVEIVTSAFAMELENQLEKSRNKIAHLLKCCDFTADGKPVVRGSTLVLMPNNDPSRELMKLKVPDVVNYCWFETKEDEQAALAKKAAQ